jgi:hypothetical protein
MVLIAGTSHHTVGPAFLHRLRDGKATRLRLALPLKFGSGR